ncbi:MAG: GAF domain-containing protein [Armatimonadota bacterium]|nr:GAF domain-containing protein [Armatimonadota bacterium]
MKKAAKSNPDDELLKQPSSQDELNEARRELAAAQSKLARLETTLEEKEIETEALRLLGQAIGSTLDLEEMLRMVADIVVKVTGTDLCLIYILNESKTELALRAASRPARGVIGKIRLKVGEGITGWVAKERKHVAINKDVFLDSRFKPVPEFQQDNYQSMLSVPLPGKTELVGVINVRTNPPHDYTETQVKLLNSIAHLVGGAVENSEQFKRLEKRASHLTALSEISRTITSDLYLDEVLQLIVAMTADSMNFRICSVMLLDEEHGELVIKATQSQSRAYIKKPNLKLGESVAGRAVTERKPITVLDVRKTPGYRYPDIAKQEGLCSLVCMPLSVKNKIIGVLNCYTAKPHVFTDEDIQLLSALASHAAIAIENAKLMVRSAIIQEMHHRVKNSLQTIASLLRLQIRYGKFDSVEQVLNESLNRILAIAAVHEMLSQENMDDVNIKKIAENIIAATTQGLISPEKRIAMVVQGDDVSLPSGKATSVALILNELIQNAVEHGFKSINAGRITVSMKEDIEEVHLTVSNDGEPLSTDFDFKKDRNLGLQIVENLVHDNLNGAFTLVSENGTKASVVFPR